jgi:hypothetical protein
MQPTTLYPHSAKITGHIHGEGPKPSEKYFTKDALEVICIIGNEIFKPQPNDNVPSPATPPPIFVYNRDELVESHTNYIKERKWVEMLYPYAKHALENPKTATLYAIGWGVVRVGVCALLGLGALKFAGLIATSVHGALFIRNAESVKTLFISIVGCPLFWFGMKILGQDAYEAYEGIELPASTTAWQRIKIMFTYPLYSGWDHVRIRDAKIAGHSTKMDSSAEKIHAMVGQLSNSVPVEVAASSDDSAAPSIEQKKKWVVICVTIGSFIKDREAKVPYAEALKKFDNQALQKVVDNLMSLLAEPVTA